MRYKILTRGFNDGITQQFTRYIGSFSTIEAACEGARYLANSRSLEHYSIVEEGDASTMSLRDIPQGSAGWSSSMG